MIYDIYTEVNLLKTLTLIVALILPFNIAFGDDALHEVNRERQAHGLRPFKLDPNLAKAAEGCAKYRAKHLIGGHTPNFFKKDGRLHQFTDFWFVPKGSKAESAGCAAWEQDGPFRGKWGSCCTYDNYTYAGAWAEIGRDGRRYMHLFVR